MAGYTGAAGTNQGSWNGNGGGTGLTTGTTVYGNTAYGPAGGMATGYATRDAQSLAGAGMAPSLGSYSNFTNPDGSSMFGGALGGQGFVAPNANAAYNAANMAYRQMGQPTYGATPVSSAPLAPMPKRVAAAPPPVQNFYSRLTSYASPYGPEAYAGAGQYGQGAFLNAADAYHNNFGTDRGYMSSGNMGAPASGPSVAPGKTNYAGSNFNGTRAAFR